MVKSKGKLIFSFKNWTEGYVCIISVEQCKFWYDWLGMHLLTYILKHNLDKHCKRTDIYIYMNIYLVYIRTYTRRHIFTKYLGKGGVSLCTDTHTMCIWSLWTRIWLSCWLNCVYLGFFSTVFTVSQTYEICVCVGRLKINPNIEKWQQVSSVKKWTCV